MAVTAYTPLQIMQLSPVIPVLVIEDVETALPMAKALLDGGINVLEVTLRTAVALDVIKLIAETYPEAVVGAGTVLNTAQFVAAQTAGAKFIISPGLTDSLLNHAKGADLPFIPGISTVSELMSGYEAGLNAFKFFPAEANGGTAALKAIGGPFPDVRFCPTGGISPQNAANYLALPNVECVGGSWLATPEILQSGHYSQITELAKAALAQFR